MTEGAWIDGHRLAIRAFVSKKQMRSCVISQVHCLPATTCGIRFGLAEKSMLGRKSLMDALSNDTPPMSIQKSSGGLGPGGVPMRPIVGPLSTPSWRKPPAKCSWILGLTSTRIQVPEAGPQDRLIHCSWGVEGMLRDLLCRGISNRETLAQTPADGQLASISSNRHQLGCN